MPAGYSGTPLARKPGIKENYKVWLLNQPDHYFKLFSDLPAIELQQTLEGNIDFAHLFFTTKEEMIAAVREVKAHLNKNGLIWISWPKKSSAISSKIDRDLIREEVLKTGLVDVKVCAVEEDWSGLKFVIRKHNR